MRIYLRLMLCSIAVFLAAAVCAQDVAISEFLAANNSTIKDEDGSYTDWIELRNTGGIATNLAGWYLTRTTNNMTQWMFPSTNLPAGGFMIVFASEKNRRVTGKPLHTNFKLSAGGSYLALVRPDLTVACEFAPGYPEQSGDISYGRYDSATLRALEIGAACKWIVPDAGTTNTWMGAGFPDAAWSNGACGAGYEYPLGNMAPFIETTLPTSTVSCYMRIPFVLGDTNGVAGLTLRMKYDDGFVAYLNGTLAAQTNAPALPAYDSTATADHPDGQAVIDEFFDIAAGIPNLAAGSNVLAIHVMDYAAGSGNLLAAPTLDVTFSTQKVMTGYFTAPTPGSNNISGVSGFTENVDFQPERGFCFDPFYLSLANETPGALIRYTQDGSRPGPTNGFVYTVPFLVTNTSVIRAAGFRSDYQPSKVTTHTYIFPEDVPYQPNMSPAMRTDPVYGPQLVDSLLAIPTLSIVLNNDDMFGPVRGIYTHPTAEGVAWERETSIEIINPDGSEGAQADCGIRMYGGCSRTMFVKKPYRLIFKDVYGPSKLHYDLFDEPEALDEFDTLILRPGATDTFQASGIIDQFMRTSQAKISGVGSHGTFMHYYINGKYWGIYNVCERPAGAFAAAYYGGDKEDWDTNHEGTYAEGSDAVEWNLMLNRLYAGVSTWDSYQRLQGLNPDGSINPAYTNYMDVVQQAEYILLYYWGATGDWPNHNWYATGRDVDPIGWKFYAWDAECSIVNSWGGGGSLYADTTDRGGVASIFAYLKANPDFRLMFADKTHKQIHNDGVLTQAKNLERWFKMHNMVEPAIVAEDARWATPSAISTWKNRQNSVVTGYFPYRNDIFLGYARNRGLYPTIDPPAFSQFGGLFTNGFKLAMSASNTIYYTTDGRDPREFGYGRTNGTQYAAPISLSGLTQVKARAQNGVNGTWSALTETWFVPAEIPPLAMTEIMYNPVRPPSVSTNWNNDDLEFIEIRNTGTGSCNLMNLCLSGQVDFIVTNSTSLSAGQYGIFAANYTAFTNRYGSGINVLGVYTGRLDNAGGSLTLKSTRLGPDIMSASYGDGQGWPKAADGAGHSLVPLVLSNQTDLLDYRMNWRASTYVGGSPGAADPTNPPGRVVINEVNAHTDYSNPSKPEYDSNDWIEFLNTASTNITVTDTNWYLSDSSEDLKKWRIPPGVVFTNGALLSFDEVANFHSPISTGFGLNKAGDQVWLSYLPGTAADRVMEVIDFEGQEHGYAAGRYPDGGAEWLICVPSRNGTNTPAARGVVISELMYHPPPLTGPWPSHINEYIELRNLSAGQSPLWSEAGTWRIAGDVSYRFPTNIVMPPGGYAVVTAFDPRNERARDVFLQTYGLTNGQVALYGPYKGHLSDREGRVALQKAQLGDRPGDSISWITVDEVVFFDRAPWPVSADGGSNGLERTGYAGSGLNPANWGAGFGTTPGAAPRKVRVSAPSNGGRYFIPIAIAATAELHPTQVAEPVEQVEFFVDAVSAGAVSNAPFTKILPAINTIGQHSVKAELEDAEGKAMSAAISFNCMNITADGGITEVSDHSARVNGVLSGEGEARIYLYWGPTDGGTDTAAWTNVQDVGGFAAGPISTYLTSIEPGTKYYCRFRAVTEDDSKWTPQTASFFSKPAQYWPYRMKISFPGYNRASALTNFPVLVVLSNGMPGFSYSQFADPHAADLRFTDENGGVELSYDVEVWNTEGASKVWVKVPEFRSNTCIYAYWGNPQATTFPRRDDGSVWYDGFEGVWHMPYDIADSSSHGHRGVDHGSEYVEEGLVGNARNFDGTNCTYFYPTIPAEWIGGNIHGLTLSMWVNPWQQENSKRSVYGGQSADSNNVFMLGTEKGTKNPQWRLAVQSHTNYAVGPLVVHGSWSMLGVVLKDNVARLYVNGAPVGQALSYADFTPGADPMLGCMATGASNEMFCGRMVDEMRITAEARSDDWVWAEFIMIASNRNMLAYETTEKLGIPAWWSARHFGSASATNAGENCDADDDGHSNWDEYIAGTDPVNGSNFFRIYTGMTNGRPCVWLPTARPGEEYLEYRRYYSLDSRTNVFQADWTEVGGRQDVEGDNTPVSFTDMNDNSIFFRGRVRME